MEKLKNVNIVYIVYINKEYFLILKWPPKS